MLCWRRISAIGTPASPCFRISTIWLSVNRDFRMGASLAPESLPSKCLPEGEAYAAPCTTSRSVDLERSRMRSQTPAVVHRMNLLIKRRPRSVARSRMRRGRSVQLAQGTPRDASANVRLARRAYARRAILIANHGYDTERVAPGEYRARACPRRDPQK